MSTIVGDLHNSFPQLTNVMAGLNCHDVVRQTDRTFSPTSEMAQCIADYFEARLGLHQVKVRFAADPVLDGWEAESYHFSIDADQNLPDVYRGPLVLRIYGNESAVPRLKHEFEVQQFLYRHNYPSPNPLFVEESSKWLGGPFLVRNLLQGQSLYDFIITPIWRLWQISRRTALLLAKLHQLPTDGFPTLSHDLLERSLADAGETIAELKFSGLAPGIEWLDRNRPGPPERLSILHLDFHPGNIIIDKDWSLSVVDWSEATLGDPHADLGCMEALIRCAPAVDVPWTTVPFVQTGRYILCKRIRKAYRTVLPIDEEKLNYYRAWAALIHLCREGWWIHGEPELLGGKKSTKKRITPQMIRGMEDYFERYSGVKVHLSS